MIIVRGHQNPDKIMTRRDAMKEHEMYEVDEQGTIIEKWEVMERAPSYGTKVYEELKCSEGITFKDLKSLITKSRKREK